jgi:hypothetical protein
VSSEVVSLPTCEVQVNRLQLDEKQYRRGDLIELPEHTAVRLGNSVRIIHPAPVEPLLVDPVNVEDETIPPDEPKRSTRHSKRSV